MIRPATAEDATAGARVLAAVETEALWSAHRLKHLMASAPAKARRLDWCADVHGDVVGWASARCDLETSEAGVAWITVHVVAELRRGGIGSALFERAAAHVASVGARRILAWSREDDGSADFARSHGFEEAGAQQILDVDPRTLAGEATPAGVALLPFAAFAGDPSPIHRIDAAAALDMPSAVALDSIPYPAWLDRYWRLPMLDHDASTVAVVVGEPAAFTMLVTDRASGRGQSGGTGTLPSHRGRGLATLVKRACLVRAAELGITSVCTGNDASNASMLAVNRKLGFRPCSRLLAWTKSGA